MLLAFDDQNSVAEYTAEVIAPALGSLIGRRIHQDVIQSLCVNGRNRPHLVKYRMSKRVRL